MATTTTNYGWDIPQSTDLVKDGATAIATLGQDIDTSVYTALAGNKSGLVLLNTTSFSAVASQSVNDVFSATYKNYRIIISSLYGTAGTSVNLRMRVGGADDSTSNSYIRRGYASTSASLSNSIQTTTSFFIGTIGTSATANAATVIDICQPFLTQNSLIFAIHHNSTADDSISMTGRHNQATSYTGFSLLPGTGNITGNVSVYGYNE